MRARAQRQGEKKGGKSKGKGKQQPKATEAEKGNKANGGDKGAEKNLVNDMAAARIQANARGRRVRRERQQS